MKIPTLLLLLVVQALAFVHKTPGKDTPSGGAVVPDDGERRRLGGGVLGASLLRRGLGSESSSKNVSSKHVSSKGGSSSKGSKGKGKGGSKASKSKGSKGKGKGGSKGSKSKKGSKGKGKGGSKGSKSKKGSKGKGKGGSKGSKSKKGSKGKGGSSKGSKGGSSHHSSKGGSVPVSSKGGSVPVSSKGGSAPVSSKGGSIPVSSKGGSAPAPSPSSSKGGSGKGSTPSGKGKGSGPLSCTVVPILFYTADIAAAEYTNPAGFGLKEVPFYNPDTLEQLGTYSDFAVDIPESDECVATGAFSFGLNPDTGSYDSQITIGFTCGSAQNAITGGSGEYGCATGYEEFAFQDDQAGLLGTELNLCGSLCPHTIIEATAP